MNDRVTYVNGPADLPPGDHYCILRFGTIYIPGCEVHPTREAWLAEIERLTARQSWGGRDWVAIVAHVPAVTTSVRVDVR